MNGKKYKGKIGFCLNSKLGIEADGGHYVYIRSVSGNRCKVNVITSLEDEHGKFLWNKIRKVRMGYLYSIPKNDAGFKRWSAIDLDGSVQDLYISDIKDIGRVKMRTRHKFFVGKFTSFSTKKNKRKLRK